MSEPYTPQMIATSLRGKSDEELATLDPRSYHVWPVRNIVKLDLIKEMIRNEIARRK